MLGSLMQAIVLSLFVGVTPWSSTWVIASLLILRSLTRGFIQSPIITVTMATLPDHQVRLGAGLRGLLNSLGVTFGIAFAGIMLQHRLAVRTLTLAEEAHLASVEHLQVLERMHEVLQEAGEEATLLPVQPDATLNRWLVQEATTLSYHDMFLLTAAIVLLTAVPLLWLHHQRG